MIWAANLPPLRRPLLVVALNGFVDAAHNARQAASFLRSRWEAEQIGQLDADVFIDYRDRRPMADVEDGLLRQIHMPKLELWAAQTLDADRDVVFLTGPEPDIQWGAFSRTIQAACRRLGVSRMLLLDAYPGMSPHTRDLRLLGVRNQVADGIPEEVAIVADYQGPIGAGHFLIGEMEYLNIPAWGISAELPPYVAGDRYPAAVLRLVEFVATFLGVTIDTTQLKNNVEAMTAQLDRSIEARPMIAELIERLEEHTDDPEATGFTLPSGDQLAAEIQQYFANPEGHGPAPGENGGDY